MVLVKFPFTDLSTAKRRPAAVVSRDGDNRRLKTFIFVPFTTTTKHADEPTEILIQCSSRAGRSAGLRADAVLKCIGITALEQRFIERRLGGLPPNVMEQLDEALAICLGLK